MRNEFRMARWVGLAVLGMMGAVAGAQVMPKPAPIPEVPATGAENSLTMQDPATFPEVKMDFPIAAGPYQPTW